MGLDALKRILEMGSGQSHRNREPDRGGMRTAKGSMLGIFTLGGSGDDISSFARRRACCESVATPGFAPTGFAHNGVGLRQGASASTVQWRHWSLEIGDLTGMSTLWVQGRCYATRPSCGFQVHGILDLVTENTPAGSTGQSLRIVFIGRILAILACLPAFLACSSRNKRASILLFDGEGTSRGDVMALTKILTSQHLAFARADSSRLNSMSESDFRAYRLVIFPGGNFEQMGKGLSSNTAGNVRNAVRRGLNYLGLCAGAFLAGDSPFNGLNLTGGVAFPFYALEGEGIRKAAVWVQAAGEPPLQHYWEDGPALSGWGDVVGKYPDGTPAIVQARVGEGWVILSGVHPEAPESWRTGMHFATPASVDNAYAKKLVDAALRQTELPHF